MVVAALLIYTNYDKIIQVKILELFPSYGSFLSKVENNQQVAKELQVLRGETNEQEAKGNKDDMGPAAEFAGISQWLNSNPLTIEHLRGKAWRKGPVGNAIGAGQGRSRQVKGAEDQVEHREGCGEILLAAALGGGVMPAMEDRRRDHVFERTERPVEIGVHKSRMRNGDRPQHDEHVGRDAGKEQHDVGDHRAEEQIDRMETRG